MSKSALKQGINEKLKKSFYQYIYLWKVLRNKTVQKQETKDKGVSWIEELPKLMQQ